MDMGEYFGDPMISETWMGEIEVVSTSNFECTKPLACCTLQNLQCLLDVTLTHHLRAVA